MEQTARTIPVLDSAARETEFVVDGETYRLRYNFDAIAGFEEGTGINPALEPVSPTIYNFMSLLYAGLRAHHPEVTIEIVMGWFNETNSAELCKIAYESFYGALPEPKKDEGGEAPNPPSA
jgi:hypothetical protein